MKIQYLSHYDKTLHLDPMDCVIAQSGDRISFHLVESACTGAGFQSCSKCIETAQTELLVQSSMTLFSFSSLSGPRGSRLLLSQFMDQFHTECVCNLLAGAYSILCRQQDLWDYSVLQALVQAPAVQHTAPALAKRKIAARKTGSNKSTAVGMPQEYRFHATPATDCGTVIRTADLPDTGFVWGPYSIRKSDGSILLSHPSFGHMRFDELTIYGSSHMVGSNRNGQILYTPNNRSRNYAGISRTCYEGYHKATSAGGTVTLLQAATAREITAPTQRWDNVVDICAGMAVTSRRGKLHAVELGKFNWQPSTWLTNLDSIVWQKDSIFFVRSGKDIRIYDSRSRMVSKQYRQVRWISPTLVCCHDGGSLYSIINPYADARKVLYIGTAPGEWLERTA